MQGEKLASQSEHADNLAPGIFGGFTLVKSLNPLEILQIPVPEELYATIIHPQIEIKTAESRAILPKEIPLTDAISQWAHVGSLVHALHTDDYELLKRSLKDIVVEPYRSRLIPHFDSVKNAALSAGALGCGISGSGPSIFTLSKGSEIAINVESVISSIYNKTDIEFETYMCKVNVDGIRVINNE